MILNPVLRSLYFIINYLQINNRIIYGNNDFAESKNLNTDLKIILLDYGHLNWLLKDQNFFAALSST